MEYIVKITQTVITEKKIKAMNDEEAIEKGNSLILNGRALRGESRLLEASVKAVACADYGKVIELDRYRH